MTRADEHEVRRGATYLGARHHQLEMTGFNVSASRFQTVVHGHAKAGLVAAQALFYAGLHVGWMSGHIVLR